MCGIVAIAGRETPEKSKSTSLRSLAHRGPDSEGAWLSGDSLVWMGHRRLSIVDLSELGRQPMHNEDKTIWSVCNGEIYNYPTLRSRLEGLGHIFYSNSDSEIILHAYEQWGENCLDRLEGMFAFILWDESKRNLFAARDRIGIKPLYYSAADSEIMLASESGALLPLLRNGTEPDPDALAYMMTLGYIPSPNCVWKGIKKLEPGCFILWNREKGISIKKYWEPPRHIEDGDHGLEKEWKQLFEGVLSEHLLSDVPIGLFLSGGIDSSSVAAGLKNLSRSVEALSIGFLDPGHDESKIAAETAEYLGFPHRKAVLEVNDVKGLVKRVAAAYDEPQGYSAPLPMYLISELAAKDFKVVLAGDGGDEVFGGYTWYQALRGTFTGKNSRWRSAFKPLISHGVSSRLNKRAAMEFERKSPLHRHAWRLFPRFLPEEVEYLFSPLGLEFDDEKMIEPLRRHFEPGIPLKRALQRIDLMTFCTDSILAKVDRASMAHALEVRVPFLDRRVVEWGLKLPIGACEEKNAKPVLRNYLNGRVPQSVLNHPKQGFSLRVLNDFNWDEAIETIENGPWVRGKYWSNRWKNLLKDGMPYREARIWVMFILNCWAETWIDKGKNYA